MIHDIDAGCHHDPIARLEGKIRFVAADKAAVSDVRLAAGHDVAANDDRSLFHALVHGDKSLETDRLSAVLLRLLHQIAVEKRLVAVGDLNDGRVDIVWKRIDDLIVYRFSAEIFIDDPGAAGHSADNFMELFL